MTEYRLLFLLHLLAFLPCMAQGEGEKIALPLKSFAAKVCLEECDLPLAVDNSICSYFPPVINQTGGSCAQASGIGYMFTYEVNRMLDRNASASPAYRFSYLFSWNMVNGGHDEGGFVDEGLNLARLYGIMTEADYGSPSLYSFRWVSGYEKYFNAMHYRVSDIYTFADSIPLMKRWLYDAGEGCSRGGVLTFSGMSNGWTMDNSYQGPSLTGYCSLLTKLPTSGSHAMTIVGYDDTVCYTDEMGVTHTGAFIVCNSWGTFSHDNGRYYYPYDFFRDPNVSSHVLSDQVIGISVRQHQPKIVYKIKLAYSSRDDLRFATAICTFDQKDAKPAFLNWHSSYAFYNAGGDYPMQGNYSDETLELALDYTDFLSEESEEIANYRLNIVRSMRGNKKGAGRLLALSVIDYRYGVPQESVYSGSLPVDIKDGNNYFEITNRADAIKSVEVESYASFTNIYDLNGKLLFQGSDVNTLFLPPGIYLFKDVRKGKVRKIIKT